MKTANEQIAEEKRAVFTVFVDGAGARPDWLRLRLRMGMHHHERKRIERVSGLTIKPNIGPSLALLANYRTVLVRKCSRIRNLSVLSLRGNYRVKDCALQDCCLEVLTLILNKQLKVKLQWVPREPESGGKTTLT